MIDQAFLINLATDPTMFVYLFIGSIALVEGPILSMILGALLRLGYFSILPIFVTLMIVDLVRDIVFYFVGYHYGNGFVRKFGKYFHITEQKEQKVKDIFHKHKYPILFLSKITNGLGFSFIVLVTAGIIKLPFRIFIFINLLGQFIWTGLLIYIGYFFSHLYVNINNLFGRLVLIFTFILIFYVCFKYVKRLKNTSL